MAGLAVDVSGPRACHPAQQERKRGCSRHACLRRLKEVSHLVSLCSSVVLVSHFSLARFLDPRCSDFLAVTLDEEGAVVAKAQRQLNRRVEVRFDTCLISSALHVYI